MGDSVGLCWKGNIIFAYGRLWAAEMNEQKGHQEFDWLCTCVRVSMSVWRFSIGADQYLRELTMRNNNNSIWQIDIETPWASASPLIYKDIYVSCAKSLYVTFIHHPCTKVRKLLFLSFYWQTHSIVTIMSWISISSKHVIELKRPNIAPILVHLSLNIDIAIWVFDINSIAPRVWILTSKIESETNCHPVQISRAVLELSLAHWKQFAIRPRSALRKKGKRRKK